MTTPLLPLSTSSTDIPDEYNFLSIHFNPKKALYADLAAPVQAPPLDNLAMCKRFLPGAPTIPTSANKDLHSTAIIPIDDSSPNPATRLLPTSSSFVKLKKEKSPQKPMKHYATILMNRILPKLYSSSTKSSTISSSPLAFLAKCYELTTPVTVYIRSRSGCRGTCSGIIHAVDHHFNMFLLNVYEKWRENVKKNGCLSDGTVVMSDICRPSNVKHSSDENVKDCDKEGGEQCLRRTYERGRFLKNLFIRGEQVILVRTAVDNDRKINDGHT